MDLYSLILFLLLRQLTDRAILANRQTREKNSLTALFLPAVVVSFPGLPVGVSSCSVVVVVCWFVFFVCLFW